MSQTSTNRSAYGNCPKCQGLVRVPLEFKPSSQVQCPHCQAEFPLHQLADLTVPDLTIVATETPTHAVPLVDRVLFAMDGEKPQKFIVPPQLAKGAKRRKKRRGSQQDSSPQPIFKKAVLPPSVPPTNSSQSSADSVLDPVSFATLESDSRSPSTSPGLESEEVRPSIRTERDTRPVRRLSAPAASSRRRRNNSLANEEKSNPVLEFIKMALGGILAFPLAYAILLWIFMMDPLGVAPTLGKSAPMLVPKVYRPKPSQKTPLPERVTDVESYQPVVPEVTVD